MSAAENEKAGRPYVCFYSGREMTVYANSSREAQQKAAAAWRVPARREYQVTPMLADVTHMPLF